MCAWNGVQLFGRVSKLMMGSEWNVYWIETRGERVLPHGCNS